MPEEVVPTQPPEINQKITTEHQQVVSVKVRQPGRFKKILIWSIVGVTAIAFIVLVLFAPKASDSINKFMKMMLGKLGKEEAAADAGAAASSNAAHQIENQIHGSEQNVDNTAGQLNKPDTVDGAGEASDFLHDIGKGK